jgi:hypothetical protein
VAEAHRLLIRQALQPLRQSEQEAATPKGSSEDANAGAKTYDVIFDGQEPRLGFDPVRETSDGVTPNSMAAEAGVQVYDELVAYRAGGEPGAARQQWHMIDFSRVCAEGIAHVRRPLELRFRRGSRMPGHTKVGPGIQAARQRLADQTAHEQARVAATGFLTRPEPLQKAPGSEQRATDAETRGRRTAVLLCDTCLTKYLQMGPAKAEAGRLKKARQKKADAARRQAQQAAEEEGDAAGAEDSSGAGQVARPKPPPTAAKPVGRKGSRVSKKGKGMAGGGKQNQKRRQPQESSAAEVAAAQGLKELPAAEERSMARAMTGEAVRWAVFLQQITSTDAGRQDATEFRRHRLPGISRLGPPLTPLPELRMWLEGQLLGLSPTAAVQEERRGHARAKPQHRRGASCVERSSPGAMGLKTWRGAMDVEIAVAKELEQLPGIQGTAATARESGQKQQRRQGKEGHTNGEATSDGN